MLIECPARQRAITVFHNLLCSKWCPTKAAETRLKMLQEKLLSPLLAQPLIRLHSQHGFFLGSGQLVNLLLSPWDFAIVGCLHGFWSWLIWLPKSSICASNCSRRRSPAGAVLSDYFLWADSHWQGLAFRTSLLPAIFLWEFSSAGSIALTSRWLAVSINSLIGPVV